MNRNKEITKLYNLILSYFNNDKDKTRLWFYTDNPLLGNIKPIDMINNGRIEKLKDFIQSSLDGNSPE